jgi:carbamoyl-phosphate synthase large subunit
VKDSDKEAVVPVAREFVELGFGVIATSGTAATLAKAKVKVTKVFKLHEGRPNVLDRIKNGDINFIINTPSGKVPREHEVMIRNAALAQKIPIMTTVRAAQAGVNGIRSLQKSKLAVRSLQEYHAIGSQQTSDVQRSTFNAESKPERVPTDSNLGVEH